jgi:anti-anti-sigma regulatory factor
MATNIYKQAKEKLYFSFEGEMTVGRTAELSNAIGAALYCGQDVEINLSRVTKLDAAGLQLMLSAKLDSILRDTQVSFVDHSPAVRKMLDICDSGNFFGAPLTTH